MPHPKKAAWIGASLWAAVGFFLGAALQACSPPPKRNVIVLCAGDSLTELGYPRHLKRLMERGGVRARVLNRGRSGNTSGEYLSHLERSRARLEETHPDFILIMLGTNDVRFDGDRTEAAEFERNMRGILDTFSRFKTRSGDASRLLLALIPPVPAGAGFPFSPASAERIEKEINPILRRLAAEKNLDLVDQHSLFAADPSLLPGVHPTEEGYRRMAELWLEALKPHLPRL